MESELEKLASLRAKRRIHTWKSPWFWGSFSSVLFLATFGFIFLIDAWHIGLNVFIPAVVGSGCFFWWLDRRHKKWERQQYKSFYEEELLELKLKK